MKTIRNILLIVISSGLLNACNNNPLRINDDIFSLQKDKQADQQQQERIEQDEPAGAVDEFIQDGQNQDQDKQHKNEELTLFQTRPSVPFREDKKSPEELAEKSVKEEVDKQAEKQVELSSMQLNTNGSIPSMVVPDKQNTPQVVDKSGIVQNADEIVQLDYEQIEIRQILEELADALGMSIVIDPSISGKITMRTSPNQPLKNKDLWAVLNMLMNEAGISLEKKAGLYYAKKSPVYLPEDVGYPSIIEGSDASVALQITPLRNISVEAALTVLKPMVGAKSKISQIEQLNMLAIIGSSEQLSRMNGLLQLIDVDPFKHRGIRLFKLKQADAAELSSELEEILKLIEGDKSSYQVMALERINSLLVVAPPRRGFKPVERWINILDEGDDEVTQEQIFIYHCKSVKCETLAGTLNSIFGQGSTKKEKTSKTDNKSSQPNAFRTVPKDSLNIKSKNTTAEKKTNSPANNKTKNTDKDTKSADIEVIIVADTDTNSLIVRTSGKDYRNLLETIKQLDQTPLQVLVNVVIAQVTLSKSQNLGLEWKFQDGVTATPEAMSLGASGLIVSATSGNFSASLNALAKDGDVNVLSRPSLLIANNQEGAINIGEEIPVRTGETTYTDTTNTVAQYSYRTTGIELKVTPHINEDGIVNMEITQALSSVMGYTDDTENQPKFANQELTTTAVLGDGETIVLGGLISTSISYSDQGIPLLKDIPGAGYLFKSQAESEERRELMLIITPKIIGPETDLNKFGKDFSRQFRAVAHYMNKELAYKNTDKITEMDK